MSEMDLEIPKFFKTRSKGKKKLLLSQTYQGLLITQPVRFIELNNEDLVLQSSEQIACLCTDKKAFLHNDKGNKIISGKITDLDVRSGKLQISDLKVVQSRWSKRREERIPPKEPLFGILYTTHHQYRGNIDDLSLQGARMLIHRSEVSGKTPKPGSAIKLHFMLPDEVELNLDGQIAHVEKESEALYMVGCRLLSGPEERKAMQPYISRSHQAILTQIDEACRKAFEPPQISDLYF